MPLNVLPVKPLGYRFTTESQSFWAAAVAPSTTPTLRTRTRRLYLILEQHQGGSYAAAKAKADSLAADPTVTDVDVTLIDPEQEIFSLTVIRKVSGAWSDWS